MCLPAKEGGFGIPSMNLLSTPAYLSSTHKALKIVNQICNHFDSGELLRHSDYLSAKQLYKEISQSEAAPCDIYQKVLHRKATLAKRSVIMQTTFGGFICSRLFRLVTSDSFV